MCEGGYARVKEVREYISSLTPLRIIVPMLTISIYVYVGWWEEGGKGEKGKEHISQV